MPLGLNFGLGLSAQRAPAAGYDNDAQAYFDAMTTPPNAARKALLNALITGWKADGDWALIGYIALLASHDEQAARINVKNPAQIATAVGTLPFTVDRGFTGDGLSGYLETGVADNAMPNWTQDTGCIFAWVNQAPLVGGAAVGLSNLSSTRLQITPLAPTARLHNTTNVAGTTTNSVGLCSGVRVDSTTTRMYRNGALEGTATTGAAAATTAGTFQFFRSNGVFLDARLAVAGAGGLVDQAKFYARLATYLAALA